MNRRVATAATIVLLLGLAAIACSTHEPSPAAPASLADVAAEGVTARVEQRAIAIHNATSERVYVATLERGYFLNELALWCFGHVDCGVLMEPGATHRVEIATIPGMGSAASEVVVFWWYDRAVMAGEPGFDGVKQITVRVR